MLIEFDEILHDLELKRAAALDPGARPTVDVAVALGDAAGSASTVAVRVRTADGGELPFDPVMAGRLVADALGVLAAAGGERTGDTVLGRGIVRSVTAQVVSRLAALEATVITTADLSALIEAALIDGGHYEVAKAVVVVRATHGTPAGGASATLKLIRRSGEVVPWSTAKIENAVRKAFLSLQSDPAPAGPLASRVAERAQSLGGAYVAIETVQDIVQEELVLAGHMRVAERYIVYRAERAMLRAQERSSNVEPERVPAIPVLEDDGLETAWDGADLRARIAFATIGLDLEISGEEIERELRRAIRPGVRRADLQKLVVLNAKSLVERDSDYSVFAGRILLTYVYEETLGWDIVRDGVTGLRDAHRGSFKRLLERGVAIDRISPALLEYDIERLADALDPLRSGLRHPRHPDALRPLPDHRQDGRLAGADRGAAALLDAGRDGCLPR